MKTKPLVSIITPTYNQAEFLDQCEKCVFDQKYPSIEWVICDDGSTDETWSELCDMKNRRGPAVRIHKAIHGGGGAARPIRKCLEMATSNIICYFPTDDLIMPEYVNRYYREFKNGHSFVVGDFLAYRYGKEVSTRRVNNYKPFGYGYLPAPMFGEKSVVEWVCCEEVTIPLYENGGNDEGCYQWGELLLNEDIDIGIVKDATLYHHIRHGNTVGSRLKDDCKEQGIRFLESVFKAKKLRLIKEKFMKFREKYENQPEE
jgi:glycosyltransferase involved in cell wall biosynthesis